MAKNNKPKKLEIEEGKLTSVVSKLLSTPPIKRDKVKVAKKKPEKLFPPQE